MKKRSEKNKKKKKLWSIILASMVGLFVIAAGGGYLYVNNVLNKIDKVDIDESKLGINEDLSKKYGKVQNIALFGVDSTDGGNGRSDSTMILTIDREHKKLKITSLMRDSYVSIDGHGNDKLNHAYAFGGPELAIKTINQNFGLNIKDFATVNFSSLPKIIDTLGGVDIDIDNEELKYINGYISHLNQINKTSTSGITKTGIQRLNGTQAMAYCRIRYTSGGDYKRTERHREVLEKLFEGIKGVSIAKYPTILNDLMPMVKTSLSTSEILALGTDMVNMGKSLEQDRFPKDSEAKSTMINNVYYLQFDKDTTKDKLHKWLFEDIK
ncbi:LCP family protein [Clostridium sp.]|uniref:LCP family protein n=1 Tax=Clostridium sp. TaxID=1506 RepID=UPI0039930848